MDAIDAQRRGKKDDVPPKVSAMFEDELVTTQAQPVLDERSQRGGRERFRRCSGSRRF